jgi:hypothetical protein
MAVLALIVFGTIGILLVIAVMMEHSTAEHPARRHLSHSESSGVAPSLGPNSDRPRGESAPAEDHFSENHRSEDHSSKEKVHEHALVG